MIRRILFVLALFTLTAATVRAGSLLDPVAAGFSPRVPVSSLGTLGSWFDPARFHMSSTLSMGTGFGSGTNALQETSFSYQFKAPISMNVSVGNSFGPGSSSGSSFFLEGLDLSYKPTGNSIFRIQYRDMRSPLQYGYSPIAGPRGFWGY